MNGLARGVLLEAVFVPCLVTGGILIAGRRLGRGRPLLAPVGVTLGFLAAFHLILGLQLAWPRSAADKLASLALLGLATAGASGRWRWDGRASS